MGSSPDLCPASVEGVGVCYQIQNIVEASTTSKTGENERREIKRSTPPLLRLPQGERGGGTALKYELSSGIESISSASTSLLSSTSSSASSQLFVTSPFHTPTSSPIAQKHLCTPHLSPPALQHLPLSPPDVLLLIVPLSKLLSHTATALSSAAMASSQPTNSPAAPGKSLLDLPTELLEHIASMVPLETRFAEDEPKLARANRRLAGLAGANKKLAALCKPLMFQVRQLSRSLTFLLPSAL